MNTHTINLAFRGLAAVLALVAPGLGWAGDHILIVTGGGAVTTVNGAVTDTGSVTTPITITAPGVNGGSAVTYGTGQKLTVQKLPVKMCKPGTVDKTTGSAQLEWLDQGVSVVGATGTLNGDVTPYSLELSQTISDNYASSNGPCTDEGDLSYTFTTRTAEIKDSTSTLITGTFTFGDALKPNGSVPEPGTLSLIGLGLAGLGWMGAKRARKARAEVV